MNIYGASCSSMYTNKICVSLFKAVRVRLSREKQILTGTAVRKGVAGP